MGRRFTDAARWNLFLADMNEPGQKCSRRENNRTCQQFFSGLGRNANNAILFKNKSAHGRFNNTQIILAANFVLHRRAVKLAVRLGAGASHRRTLRTIEQTELNSGTIRNPAHQAIKRIDLAHQMSLAQTADGRIARHLADGRKLVGDKSRVGTKPRRSRCGFNTRMAAADDNDIKLPAHGGSLVQARSMVKAETSFT